MFGYSNRLQRDSLNVVSSRLSRLGRSTWAAANPLQDASRSAPSSTPRQLSLGKSSSSQNTRPKSTGKLHSAALLKLTDDPGNSLQQAEVLNSPTFSGRDQVNAGDRNDFFRFQVDQSGVFSANLTGLSGDADVRLISDRNRNGTIDSGEVLAWQWERGTGNESIRRSLKAGTYFVQVTNPTNQTANYSLSTRFSNVSRSNQDFSIQVNFGQGLSSLGTQARNAITSAAQFWENVIPSSSFNTAQTLTINTSGTQRSDNVLAFAGPTRVATAANGRVLPTRGSATINTRFASRFNSNPNFLRNVLIHEFGHVLGIGTLWDTNGNTFINRTNSTYQANSYAGQAYGELIGSSVATAIPVEPNVFGHWDEGRFDTELMTPIAEGETVATPLSQVTIGALRDLGWNVNYGAAQSYTLPNARARTTTSRPLFASTGSTQRYQCGCSYHLAKAGMTSIGQGNLQRQVLGA